MFYNRLHRREPELKPAPGYTTQKLEWGAPIWIFMHTLLSKIKPECYLEVRDSVWVLITRICQNLPCPECSAHATEYLRTVRKEQLHTVFDFEWMLFQFHNTVNARKLVPPFSEDTFHVMYFEKKWEEVFPPFLKIMKQSYGSMLQMFSNDSRRQLATQIVEWFRRNRHCFI
jgi:hypothetical protein